MPPDTDDTVVFVRRVPRRRPWAAMALAGAGLAACGGGVAAWRLGLVAPQGAALAPPATALPSVAAVQVQPAPPVRSVAPAPPPAVPAAALALRPQASSPLLPAPASPSVMADSPPPGSPVAYSLGAGGPAHRPPPLATESEILGRAPRAAEALRFALAPAIMVVQFAALADQADMLNRTAALVERAGYPHDRVLDPADLERRIRAAGDTPERVYLGHDYRASEVMRFFATADRDGAALTPGEQRLRRMAADWGWTPDTDAALITLVRDDRDAGLDHPARATILRHELSHGVYFTDPAYAQHSESFWADRLSEPERRRFRAFLASEGYDTANEDLVVNEFQAYLMHTADPRFFSAAIVGIPARRIEALRVLFLAGMPPGWLRDSTTVPPSTH